MAKAIREAGDMVKEASPPHFTLDEEWAEIIRLQGMLVDRIDRLVVRAGCKDRSELMKLLRRRAGAY